MGRTHGGLVALGARYDGGIDCVDILSRRNGYKIANVSYITKARECRCLSSGLGALVVHCEQKRRKNKVVGHNLHGVSQGRGLPLNMFRISPSVFVNLPFRRDAGSSLLVMHS